MDNTIVVESRHHPDVCLKLLMDHDGCDPYCVELISEERDDAGRIMSFSFSIHKKINYRNGFQTFLYGNFVERNDGAFATCKLGISRQAAIGLGLVNVLMILFAIQRIYIINGKYNDIKNWTQGEIIGIAIPAIICAVMWGIFFVGRLIAAAEAEGITRFLEDKFGANCLHRGTQKGIAEGLHPGKF